MQALECFVQMVNDSENIVFFGGAGVSTESGLPDFRSEDGLYRQTYAYPPETMLSHDFFMAHTEEFFAFYRDKMLYPDAEPNTTHRTLAALERAGKLKAVVTQNIDGLHQAAGSRKVYELHGSVRRNTCMRCKRHYDLPLIQRCAGVPRCACGGVVKPDVVLYGEGLDSATVEGAVAAIARCDMLIVGGTSLAVYPAAGLIDAYTGTKLVLINRSPTPADQRADLCLHVSLGEAFAALGIS